MAATAFDADLAIRALQDRSDITDVLYRYASTIDRFDLAGLRAVLADDVWAQAGPAASPPGRTAPTPRLCCTAPRPRSTASTSPACVPCWPTTCGPSTATPIR